MRKAIAISGDGLARILNTIEDDFGIVLDANWLKFAMRRSPELRIVIGKNPSAWLSTLRRRAYDRRRPS